MSKTNGYVIDSGLDFYSYLGLVDELVDGYFDESGKYQPHLGRFNAMTIFFNLCVKKSPFDGKLTKPVTTPDEIANVINDPNFIRTFNGEIADSRAEDTVLRFGCAYDDAIDIVSSANMQNKNIGKMVAAFISDISDKFGEVINSDGVQRMLKMSKDIVTSDSPADKAQEFIDKVLTF